MDKLNELQSRPPTQLEEEIRQHVKDHPGCNAEQIADSDEFNYIDRFLIVYAVRFLLSESLIESTHGDPLTHSNLYWRDVPS